MSRFPAQYTAPCETVIDSPAPGSQRLSVFRHHDGATVTLGTEHMNLTEEQTTALLVGLIVKP